MGPHSLFHPCLELLPEASAFICSFFNVNVVYCRLLDDVFHVVETAAVTVESSLL